MFAEISIPWSQLFTSPLELFAVVTGIVCVGLITFEDYSKKLAWWNWPIGILTSGAYIYIFWNYALYFNSVLQMFYVGSGFYGAWAWKHGGKDKTELPITKLSLPLIGGMALACIAISVVLAASLDRLGVHSAAPFWDALLVVFSLTAQFVMTRKYIQHWWFWIAVDVIGIALFASQGLYLTSVLYFVYGSLCVRGIFTWRKAYAAEQIIEPPPTLAVA